MKNSVSTRQQGWKRYVSVASWLFISIGVCTISAYSQTTNTFPSSGSAGIGTTSPDYPLDIRSTTANAASIQVVDTSGGSRIWVVPKLGTAGANALSVAGDSGLIFSTGSVDTGGLVIAPWSSSDIGIRIDSSGGTTVGGDLTVSGNIAAKYQDIAEWVPSQHSLPAGTVVIVDSSRVNFVTPSVRPYDTRVAGVVSDTPGIVLGVAGESKVKIATTGRVKVRVDATQTAIQVGDLLVTSDKEGVAKKSEPVNLGGVEIHRPGTLIGKALEPLADGEGEILVLLSLQ